MGFLLSPMLSLLLLWLLLLMPLPLPMLLPLMLLHLLWLLHLHWLLHLLWLPHLHWLLAPMLLHLLWLLAPMLLLPTLAVPWLPTTRTTKKQDCNNCNCVNTKEFIMKALRTSLISCGSNLTQASEHAVFGEITKS